MSSEKETLAQDTEKEPSKEEILAFYKEQIEIKELQLRLQQLNRDYAVARTQEVMAIGQLAQMTSPQPPDPEEDDQEPAKQRNLKKAK